MAERCRSSSALRWLSSSFLRAFHSFRISLNSVRRDTCQNGAKIKLASTTRSESVGDRGVNCIYSANANNKAQAV